jgi:hypothetical protein
VRSSNRRSATKNSAVVATIGTTAALDLVADDAAGEQEGDHPAGERQPDERERRATAAA